jgi:hypothetical protein
MSETAAILRKPEAQRQPELERAEAANREGLESLERTDLERIRVEKILRSARADCDHNGSVLKAAEAAEVEARNANLAAETECNSAQAELSVLEEEHAAAMGVVAPVLKALMGQRQLKGEETGAHELWSDRQKKASARAPSRALESGWKRMRQSRATRLVGRVLCMGGAGGTRGR